MAAFKRNHFCQYLFYLDKNTSSISKYLDKKKNYFWAFTTQPICQTATIKSRWNMLGEKKTTEM